MDRDELKARVLAGVDAGAEQAVALTKAIGAEPELGYREERTAAKVRDAFDRLGLHYESGLAITGIKAVLRGGKPGPTVAVIGELDALPIESHPDYNPETGGVHACGHHCQMGSVIAAASGLLAEGVAENLAGNVIFFAVPAEESVEVEWRLDQRAAGRLEFLGGKAELVKLGAFDDIDLAMMVHTATADEYDLATGSSTNGHVIKFVKFIGKAAHAGGAPHKGVNALNAAMLAMQAVHAQRETFQDADAIRIHPILTRGGAVVNSVPADVRLESFVRGASVEAIEDANRKFDRAMRAGAMAIGAQVEITTLPGYMPLRQNPAMNDLFRANAIRIAGERRVTHRPSSAAGTDMGDISQILPAIHPGAAGATGTGHGSDYRIGNYDTAVLYPGRAMALTVIDLLTDDASRAREILERDKPAMTRAAYLAFLRGKDAVERYQR